MTTRVMAGGIMMAEVGEQAEGLCGGGLSRIIFVARVTTREYRPL